MLFIIETEQNKKISQGKFVTSVYQKPTFSGVSTNFDNFLPDIHKIGIYTHQ